MIVKPQRMRFAAGVLLAGAGISVLAACSGSSSTSSSASPTGSTSASGDANTGPHNQQDIEFLQGMIPHHEQAVVMATMLPLHTTDPAMLKLASGIEAAQAPEIAQMKEWLALWGVTATPSMAGHDMSNGSISGMPGMMTADQLSKLDKAQGTQFNQMWLTMMIEHHEGAVEMSQQELAKGENPQTKALAQTIIDGQTKEIAQMKAMLNK